MPMLVKSQPLFQDDFESETLDMDQWSILTGNASFFQGSQMNPVPPIVSNGRVRLRLDTYNPSALIAGDSFFGSEIHTIQTYSPPVVFEARVRLIDPVPGMVAAMFAYKAFVSDAGQAVRNEIDFEILTNELGAEDDCVQILTNVFQEVAVDSGEGNSQYVCLPDNITLTEFNTFQIEWLENRISWYVNGILVREETEHAPQDDMHFFFNFWAPTEGNFLDAFNADLTPAGNPAENETFWYEVDYVSIYDKPSAFIDLSAGKLHLPVVSVDGLGSFNAVLNLLQSTTIQLELDHVVQTSLVMNQAATFLPDTGILNIPRVTIISHDDTSVFYQIEMRLQQQNDSDSLRFDLTSARVVTP